MVIKLLLEFVVVTVNGMKCIFFMSKWISLHCHAKRT